MISPVDFRRKLKEAGWTQKAISLKLGHVPSWLSRKISGARDMNCDELVKICALTGISPTELLGFEMPAHLPEDAEKRISRELAALLPDKIIDELYKIREQRRGNP
jgi:transcriptional regulator with XRE-family HTH domain